LLLKTNFLSQNEITDSGYRFSVKFSRFVDWDGQYDVKSKRLSDGGGFVDLIARAGVPDQDRGHPAAA
jgi:hypothetical protein